MATNNTNNVEQPVVESTNTTKKPKIQLNRYQVISIVCASLLVALALAVSIYFIVKKAQEEDVPPHTPPAVVLNAENYNQITVGMTYEQVFALIGDGKRASNDNIDQLTYMWQDNGGRYIIITFSAVDAPAGQQGKVAGSVLEKNQIGIIQTPQA